jgi:hypothetical protein
MLPHVSATNFKSVGEGKIQSLTSEFASKAYGSGFKNAYLKPHGLGFGFVLKTTLLLSASSMM